MVNWIKAEMLDPNPINGIKVVLQSKTSVEEMELKVTDRALIARAQEMEQRLESLEAHAYAPTQRLSPGPGKLDS